MGCTLPGEIEWWCSQTSGFVYVDCQPSRLWLSHARSSWHWQRLWATVYVWSKIVRPEKEKVCFLWHLSCKYTQGLAQWLCPLELPWRSSNLHPEQLANKSRIEAEGSKWRGKKQFRDQRNAGQAKMMFWQALFPVCPQIATDSGIERRWSYPPRGASEPGGCRGGLLCLVFSVTKHLLAFSQQGPGTTNNL